ncbi:DUF4129 domain-containing protein [Marilutibacter aestuarii]|uniref:DUF4129 domain-containing protein n=1 Tax=Marilutibacter aestuarii TaxID=1706195 RepID=A0A508ADW6_9GAMM|nr:DUF4129 domain-containing protein [Lysobacter aestuarii]TQD45245.1 DUF4129 domain-containing protein [Lysobacter aestuarii]
MNLESLTVALRPRTAWEAVELGTALARRHATAIWVPWLLASVVVFTAVNALAWGVGMMWLAPLTMWWLKPAFDRIPLYVLSRAVFGTVPRAADTLRAQFTWGLRWLLPYLTWRRLSPVRSMNLPVDLLEGGQGAEARARRRILVGPSYGVASLTTLLCVHFELAVYLGTISLALLFVPPEYLARTAQGLWEAMQAPPTWLDLTTNAVYWLAVTLIQPFYVGAGFGLYLNRRTEVEAWDIEIVLRRLAARLARAGAPLLLALALLGPAALAPAWGQDTGAGDGPVVQDAGEADADEAGEDVTGGPATLPAVFGEVADDAPLREAVARAYEDPTVSPKRTVTTWKPIKDDEDEEKKPRDMSTLARFGEAIGKAIALVGEYGLWFLLGMLVVVLLVTARRWLPWLRRGMRRPVREDSEIEHTPTPTPAPLPDDIPAAVRRLWQAGHPRDALALLYRASVAAMSARADVVLVPGATEAAVLRASRRMREPADREAFEAMVRQWQYAAYAGRLPSEEAFEAQLALLADRFHWRPGAAPSTQVPA